MHLYTVYLISVFHNANGRVQIIFLNKFLCSLSTANVVMNVLLSCKLWGVCNLGYCLSFLPHRSDGELRKYWNSVPGCNQTLITTFADEGVRAHLSFLIVILL